MAQNNKPAKTKPAKQQQSKKSLQEKTGEKKRRTQTQSDEEKQSKKCRGGRCCKWLMGSIFLVVLIAAAVCYDTEVNGKGVFAKSAFGKVLDNAGMLPTVEKVWYTTMSASARGYQFAAKHLPPYASPIIQLICDLYKLIRNTICNVLGAVRDVVKAKLPVAGDFLEQYIPGLPKKIEQTAEAAGELAESIYLKTIDFFYTQVLVGHLSPESLGRTLNDTQNVAIKYLNLFHKKVDTYAKLK